MQYGPEDSNHQPVLNELTGSLRQAVEQVRAEAMSHDTMERSLQRARSLRAQTTGGRQRRKSLLALASIAALLLIGLLSWPSKTNLERLVALDNAGSLSDIDNDGATDISRNLASLMSDMQFGIMDANRTSSTDELMALSKEREKFQTQLKLRPFGFINNFGEERGAFPPANTGSELNELGYYPPARALVVKGANRIHTNVGAGIKLNILRGENGRFGKDQFGPPILSKLPAISRLPHSAKDKANPEQEGKQAAQTWQL